MFEINENQVELLEQSFDNVNSKDDDQSKSDAYRLGNIIDRINEGNKLNKYDVEFIKRFGVIL